MTTIELNLFQLFNLLPNTTCVIIGKRSTGKTTLINDIIFHKQPIPVKVVITTKNNIYNDTIPIEYECTNYSTVINNVLTNHDFNSSIIIMDDIRSKSIDDITLTNLFMNGGHHNLSTILSTQHPLLLSPVLRHNSDYVFLFHENSIQIRKQLYQYYGNIFPTFQLFNDMMDQYTSIDYQCLVICNRIKSNNIADCVFWYKANI